ncbi:PhnB protein [Kitasatospora sp. MAP12-15]|uniref:VOC family protein n=1 Tax=unclassified Kitasatospora TaxID=2633591 RepID=UPI002473550E|nr:VOC family protein [Kitasatospora sp. MAP12-44]MDH6114390.1 PhnB protein [Kitasatospora sp. MAP12-44]
MSAVKPIPDGYPRVSPYLFVDGAAAAIDFYTTVLGAAQRGDRMTGPDGRVGHAELQLGDSLIMLADEYPEIGAVGPKTVGGTPVLLNVYVEDVDAVFGLALANGATTLRPVENQFYGDRSGSFADPFGHHWNVSTHIEDVPPEAMPGRAAKAMGGES